MVESSARSLTWKETGRFQSKLFAEDNVVATLSWEKGWEALATGESTEGRWTFKRSGRLTPKIEVRTLGSKISSATLTLGWRGGGVMSFPTGQTFRLTPKGFWSSEWVLTDHNQKRQLTMRPDFAWGRAGASVMVEPIALSINELPLLTMLCWYAVLLTSYDRSDGDGAIIASLVATGSM
jgi:hypothetical protein